MDVFPRLVHIVRGSVRLGHGPKYEIRDANRYGEEDAGFAESPSLLGREGVSRWLLSEGIPHSEIDGLLRTVDEQGYASVLVKPGIGPRIVRAWFDTVINPLVEPLELELTLIEKRNWTWSFRPADLELIRPARRYLRHTAVANLDQICHLNPAIAANVDSHDAAVSALLNAVAALHKGLATAKTFKDLCGALWDPNTLVAIGLHDAQEIFGAYGPEDLYDDIAQHIVNNSGELPAYYTTGKFWNRNREMLLGALDLPEIRPLYESVLEAGRHLTRASRTLLQQLKDLRLMLSLEHDIPYVPGELGSPVL
jgi:hypothetical protein